MNLSRLPSVTCVCCVRAAGPMRQGVFAMVIFAQWLYVASLLPGAPPNFVEAAGKFGMFSGNMR